MPGAPRRRVRRHGSGYASRITSSRNATRSSNGRNEDFIALIVSRPIRPSRSERVHEVRELLRQRRRRHQPVVRVHRHAELQLHQQPDRMLLDRGRRPEWTFDVGQSSSGTRRSRTRWASPHLHLPVRTSVDVVHDPDAVPEPLRAAELQRLPDRRQPEPFAGVDREVEVLTPDVLERVEVPGRREARLRARDVEPDDASLPPADREVGDLERAGRRAHRRQQRPDPDPRGLGSGTEPSCTASTTSSRSSPCRRCCSGA